MGKKAFVEPTAAEVEEYAKSIGFALNGEEFVSYYAAKGWKVGARAPMVDWKAAVRYWKTRRQKEDKALSRKPLSSRPMLTAGDLIESIERQRQHRQPEGGLSGEKVKGTSDKDVSVGGR